MSKFVIFLVKVFGRLYLFLYYGIAKTELYESKTLFDAFSRALSGKSRCIIAFRHPSGGEPQLLTWFTLFKLRSLAARSKIRFSRRPHIVFVYSYEVVRWGGWVPRFIMPNLGGMQVHHSKMDSKGMNTIYNAITNGPYPVAIAPEGGVSYTSNSFPRLEPGAIRIGFNAADRLAEKEADCQVEILPVSVHYRFGSWGKLTLELLIRKIEKACGLNSRKRKKMPFVERVQQCRDHILESNETRYKLKIDDSFSFEKRLEQIANIALETAEQMVGIKGEEDFFFRMHRMRQIYWDRIFVPGVENLDNKAQLERSLLDLQAGEAWYIGQHLELADLCWYFRVSLPAEDAPLHEKVEYIQNLWDFASRSMGGALKDRISLFPRKVVIHAAPVINLSERLSEYKKDKKAAIAKGLADLEKVFLDSIEEANRKL